MGLSKTINGDNQWIADAHGGVEDQNRRMIMNRDSEISPFIRSDEERERDKTLDQFNNLVLVGGSCI